MAKGDRWERKELLKKLAHVGFDERESDSISRANNAAVKKLLQKLEEGGLNPEEVQNDIEELLHLERRRGSLHQVFVNQATEFRLLTSSMPRHLLVIVLLVSGTYFWSLGPDALETNMYTILLLGVYAFAFAAVLVNYYKAWKELKLEEQLTNDVREYVEATENIKSKYNL